jgi:hypothetical protein
VSYYEDGIQIFDVKNPKKPVRTGYFDTHYQSDDSLTTTGGYLGAWSAYTELPSKNVIVVDMQNGLYVLDARKAYGLSVGVNDIPTEEVVRVFPNPVQDEVIFTATRNETATIRVFDMLGKEVLKLNQVTLDGFRLSTNSLLQKGIYIIKIDNTTFTQSLKIVKQ